MRVSCRDGHAHSVWHAGGGVDGLAGLHAGGDGNGAEPVDVVIDDHEAAGVDEAGELVVVEGEGGCFCGEGVECCAEPDVFADDFGGGLNICAGGFLTCFTTLGLVVEVDGQCGWGWRKGKGLTVRYSPASGTSGSGLLWDGECDTWLKGADDESTLSVSGAARYTDT